MDVRNPERRTADSWGAGSPTDEDGKSPGDTAESFSPRQSVKSTSESVTSSVSSSSDNVLLHPPPSDYDRLYPTLEGLEPAESHRKRRSAVWLSGGGGGGSRACSCEVECAAVVCCCQCALLHLLLAAVKVPLACGRNAFGRKSNFKNEGDDRIRKGRSCRSAWSSRRVSEPVTEPSSPQAEGQNVWVEFYAAGHMGFAGPPLDRA